MASSIRDVAARACLSVATVSLYIYRLTVFDCTRLAIVVAILALVFHPYHISLGLCFALSFSVAILLPMLDSTFCTSMISSIESTLLPFVYSVILFVCHYYAVIVLRITLYLIDRIVDVIVLIPYASDRLLIVMIQFSYIPLILLHHVILYHASYCIVLDNVLAGFVSTQRLIDLGHKDIGILLPSSALITAFMKMFCPISFPLSSIT